MVNGASFSLKAISLNTIQFKYSGLCFDALRQDRKGHFFIKDTVRRDGCCVEIFIVFKLNDSHNLLIDNNQFKITNKKNDKFNMTVSFKNNEKEVSGFSEGIDYYFGIRGTTDILIEKYETKLKKREEKKRIEEERRRIRAERKKAEREKALLEIKNPPKIVIGEKTESLGQAAERRCVDIINGKIFNANQNSDTQIPIFKSTKLPKKVNPSALIVAVFVKIDSQNPQWCFISHDKRSKTKLTLENVVFTSVEKVNKDILFQHIFIDEYKSTGKNHYEILLNVILNRASFHYL